MSNILVNPIVNSIDIETVDVELPKSTFKLRSDKIESVESINDNQVKVTFNPCDNKRPLVLIFGNAKKR